MTLGFPIGTITMLNTTNPDSVLSGSDWAVGMKKNLFDKDSSTYWCPRPNSVTDVSYVGYSFDTLVLLTGVVADSYATYTNIVKRAAIEASNDKAFSNVAYSYEVDGVTTNFPNATYASLAPNSVRLFFNIPQANYSKSKYKYWRWRPTLGDPNVDTRELYFFGF